MCTTTTPLTEADEKLLAKAKDLLNWGSSCDWMTFLLNLQNTLILNKYYDELVDDYRDDVIVKFQELMFFFQACQASEKAETK